MRTNIYAGALILPGLFGLAASQNSSPTIREVYKFNDGTFIENVAVRPNGHVLLNTFDRARMYSIDPAADAPEPQLVAEFPEVNALTGIAEVAPDVFAVMGGNRTQSFGFERGATKLFTVSIPEEGPAAAVVKLVTPVPEGILLNGMATLPSQPNTVFAAESAGAIYRFNVATGARDIIIEDENLAPLPEADKVPIGVNGIEVFESFVYFANSARGLFGRIPIEDDGSQAGPVEIVTRLPGNNVGNVTAYDDFGIALGCNKAPSAYVGTHPNSVNKIGLFDGDQSVYAGGGNSTTIQGPTSVAVAKDYTKIYVVTGAGQLLEIGI